MNELMSPSSVPCPPISERNENPVLLFRIVYHVQVDISSFRFSLFLSRFASFSFSRPLRHANMLLSINSIKYCRRFNVIIKQQCQQSKEGEDGGEEEEEEESIHDSLHVYAQLTVHGNDFS